jgi:DNA-binding HxlR family transcriptional regulator
MRWRDLHREPCSVARTISVIGDRWTLLILRDCFVGIRRFDGFEARLGMTRHVLADRLRRLVEAGVLRKEPYQERPVRHEYRLTKKGLDLYPIMMAIVHWGDTHMAEAPGRPVLHRHKGCGRDFDPVITCSECGEKLDARAVEVHAGPAAPGVLSEAAVGGRRADLV